MEGLSISSSLNAISVLDDIYNNDKMNREYRNSYKIIRSKCKNYKDNIKDDENYERVYVIGDIHGDLNSILCILLDIGCIIITDDNITWNPRCRNICIVQSGDILDGYRPDSPNNVYSNDIIIVKMLLALDCQARQYNSRIILIYGNHEFFVLGNAIAPVEQRASWYEYSIRNVYVSDERKHYNAEFNLIRDYILCNHKIMVCINGLLICHMGIVKNTIESILKQINYPIAEYMRLSTREKLDVFNACVKIIMFYFIMQSRKHSVTTSRYANEYVKFLYDINTARNVITQHHPRDHTTGIDNELRALSEYFTFDSLIVGHVVQENREVVSSTHNINSTEKTLYHIDVALSDAFNKYGADKKLQYLECQKNVSGSLHESSIKVKSLPCNDDNLSELRHGSELDIDLITCQIRIIKPDVK